MSATEPDRFSTFFMEVVDLSSFIEGNKAVRAAARTFKEIVSMMSALRRVAAWKVLFGLELTQVMPGYFALPFNAVPIR